MTPKLELDQKLSQVRRRWLWRDGLLCAARTSSAVILVSLLLGWVDYRMDFTPMMRLIALIMLAAVFAHAMYHWIRPTFRQQRDALAAAARVEATFPAYHGRLISRVEFRRHPSTSSSSQELMDLASERIEQAVAPQSLTNAIDLRVLRLPMIAAGVALLLVLQVFLAAPAFPAIWVKRTLLPFGDTAWPRRTHIVEIPEAFPVRRGDALTLRGRLAGEIPSIGSIEWDTVNASDGSGRKSFDIERDGRFEVSIGPLLESITCDLTVGDASLPDLQVEVVVPPELAGVDVTYHYPPFTNRAPDRAQSGDLRAIVGTRVEIRLESDRPVKRMQLDLEMGGDKRAVPVTLRSDREGTAEFTIEQRGRYHVALYDHYGFTSDAPATVLIDALENALPSVKLTRPGLEHRATPATRLSMLFDASDDFGVTGATLHYRRAGESTSQPAKQQSVRIPAAQPAKEWAGRFAWDLGLATFEPGDTIEYYLEVHDEGLHLSEAKAGVSSTHRLDIVDPDTLRQSLEARLREVFAELEGVIRQQSIGIDEVSTAIVSLPDTAEAVIAGDVRRVQAEHNRQVRIRRQVGRMADRLRATADELADSFLASPERVAQLRQMADTLDVVAAESMASAATRLEESQNLLRTLSQEQEAR